MLIPLIFLLQSAALPTLDEVHARDCQKLVETDPISAIVNASEWQKAGGSYRAEACLASGYAAQGKFADASRHFQSAARAAAAANDTVAALYWTQAGNAAIAAGQPGDAAAFLGLALASPAQTKPVRAGILIDRARAYVASNQPDLAKADLTEVRRIAPDSAAGWLLSATLARRMNALADAQNFVVTAARLSPADAGVALEAGNIAVSAGAYVAARDQWQQAIRIAPDSAQAATATALLAQLAEQGLGGITPAAATPIAPAQGQE
jgi:tetratricopeptide (TPR) repeat protein